ncbi:hypothetical protein SCP_1104170 [Sparassis crispa]|uniref:Ricin B lectin domain-containing protein n=1 Tax=Sparassis crispa TaxID=139825 RepID=A0A401H014_9APHY|nr:hypothetical protein SCP_1104170 [Sparassis crispa]GBE87740.1 hypothetical protein SCP_1104170 [Sparassis crispa]
MSIAGIYKIENTKYGLIGADAGGVTKAPVVATTSPTTVGIFNVVPAGDDRYSISMIATNTFLPEQLLTMNDGNKIYGVKQSSTGSSAPLSWYIYEDTAQRGQYVIMSSDYKLWSLSSGKAGTQVQYKGLTAKQLENVKQVVSGKQLFSRHLLAADSNDTLTEEPNWKFTPATEEPPKPLSPGRYTIKDVKNGAINVECSGNNDAYLNVVSATQAAVWNVTQVGTTGWEYNINLDETTVSSAEKDKGPANNRSGMLAVARNPGVQADTWLIHPLQLAGTYMVLLVDHSYGPLHWALDSHKAGTQVTVNYDTKDVDPTICFWEFRGA